MNREELQKFIQKKDKETENEGNIFGPPISGQEAFDILIEHFLGPDWYSTSGVTSVDQVNMEALCRIILDYPGVKEKKNRSLFHKIKNVLKLP